MFYNGWPTRTDRDSDPWKSAAEKGIASLTYEDRRAARGGSLESGKAERPKGAGPSKSLRRLAEKKTEADSAAGSAFAILGPWRPRLTRPSSSRPR